MKLIGNFVLHNYNTKFPKLHNRFLIRLLSKINTKYFIRNLILLLEAN